MPKLISSWTILKLAGDRILRFFTDHLQARLERRGPL